MTFRSDRRLRVGASQRASWATAAPYRWARWCRATQSATSCSSRALARRPSRALPTDGACCAAAPATHFPPSYAPCSPRSAVLRSSVREFLCSEAMFHLGVRSERRTCRTAHESLQCLRVCVCVAHQIPTTRAGCLIVADTQVLRDPLYDGRARNEPAAVRAEGVQCASRRHVGSSRALRQVVLRIAPTFVRFGSFQIANGPCESTGRAGPSEGRFELVQQVRCGGVSRVMFVHFTQSLTHRSHLRTLTHTCTRGCVVRSC